MFTKDSRILNHRLTVPLTSVSKAVGDVFKPNLSLFDRTIKSLFANGEQGFAYDPNDLTTMFKDAAGTIPVTSVGQPVGLIKDKSGRNNHAYQTVSASRPILNDRVNVLDNSTPVTTGGSWEVAKTTLSYPSMNTPHGMKTVALLQRSADGACYTGSKSVLVLPSLTRKLVFSCIVKASTATHASLRLQEVYPTRVDAIFNLAAGTVHSVGQSGNVFTDPEAEIKNLGDGWYYIAVSGVINTSSATKGHISFSSSALMIDGIGSDITAAGYAYGADLRAYSTTTPVSLPLTQEVELGVTKTKDFPYYLTFDGVDDFLQTNNIDFTATDKVSLFVGVRKLSDVNNAFVYGLSEDINTSNGAFSLLSLNTGRYQSQSKGTSISYTTSSQSKAPISAISTQKLNINADINSIAINKTDVSNFADQGTGNYGNYPLYIGRRGGTSLPFNGHLYSLIGVGRLTTDNETVAIEKELAKRTGVTLSV